MGKGALRAQAFYGAGKLELIARPGMARADIAVQYGDDGLYRKVLGLDDGP